MELTKEIWFDTNSMPPKNMIWYRGKGKFYEWSNDKWVIAYDLGNTPSQEELNDIADIIESKTGEELQDKSLSGILNGILELATAGGYKPVVIKGIPQDLLGEYTKEQICATLEITPEDLDGIMSGRLNILIAESNSGGRYGYLALLVEEDAAEQKVGLADISTDGAISSSVYFYYDKTTNLYNIAEF